MRDATLTWYTQDDALQQLSGAWQQLEAAVGPLEFFQTHAWLSSWWHCYQQAGDRLLVGLLQEGETVLAILPFFVRPRRLGPITLRWAQFLGVEEVSPSTMDILATTRGLDLLRGALASQLQNGWREFADILDLAPVRLGARAHRLWSEGNSGQHRPFAAPVEATPILDAPASFDAWMANLGSSTRKDVRRKRGQFAKDLEMRVEYIHEPTRTPEALNRLAVLNRKRLGQQGKRGGFLLPRFAQFQQQLAKSLAQSGQLHIFELWRNDKHLSSALLFRHGHKWYAYQTGVDPDFLEYSPGAILDFHVLHHILEFGQAQFIDYGLGEQDYKIRFGAVPRPAMRLRLPARTWRGRMLRRLLQWREWRAERAKISAPGVLQPCES